MQWEIVLLILFLDQFVFSISPDMSGYVTRVNICITNFFFTFFTHLFLLEPST